VLKKSRPDPEAQTLRQVVLMAFRIPQIACIFPEGRNFASILGGSNFYHPRKWCQSPVPDGKKPQQCNRVIGRVGRAEFGISKKMHEGLGECSSPSLLVRCSLHVVRFEDVGGSRQSCLGKDVGHLGHLGRSDTAFYFTK
jgi:hypothetical protein